MDIPICFLCHLFYHTFTQNGHSYLPILQVKLSLQSLEHDPKEKNGDGGKDRCEKVMLWVRIHHIIEKILKEMFLIENWIMVSFYNRLIYRIYIPYSPSNNLIKRSPTYMAP